MHFRAIKTVDEESGPPQFVYSTTVVVSLCLVAACDYNDGFLSLKSAFIKKNEGSQFSKHKLHFVQHKIILKYSRVHFYSLTPYEG